MSKLKLFKKLLLYGFALSGLSVIGLMIWQAVMVARDRNAFPAPGTLVQTEHGTMHMITQGDQGPTVILETGMGHNSLVWNQVINKMSGPTRVVSYDRTGFGWSEDTGSERDCVTIAEELHAMLTKADIPPPYIMVGHSMGAMHVRVFKELYPRDVVGMVLLDPSHEEMMERLPPQFAESFNGLDTIMNVYQIMTRLGIPRILGMHQGRLLEDVDKPAYIALANRNSEIKTMAREIQAMQNNFVQTQGLNHMGDLPLIVLSAGKHDPSPEFTPEVNSQITAIWRDLHQEITDLSTRGKQITVAQSGHNIHMEDPAAVVAAIEEILEQVRIASAQANTQNH